MGGGGHCDFVDCAWIHFLCPFYLSWWTCGTILSLFAFSWPVPAVLRFSIERLSTQLVRSHLYFCCFHVCHRFVNGPGTPALVTCLLMAMAPCIDRKESEASASPKTDDFVDCGLAIKISRIWLSFMFFLFCNVEPNWQRVNHVTKSHTYNRYLFTSPRIDGFAEDSQYEVGLTVRAFDSHLPKLQSA